MCSFGCGSCRCCCCSCGCGGGSDNGVTTLPSFPDTPVFSASQFPVYVSYPAFFTGDSAINGANIALFTSGGNGSGRCGCRG
ncbi:MAG: hypothetical protein HFF07_00955 [Oscillospiraceae bacterium]|nr:hypothetical protein [Oscillospiraceae bacterium]